MSKSNDRLNRLQNTFTCPASWEAMSGNARKRYCTECKKHVYDFAQLNERQIAALLEASRGNLCARLTRNTDGSIQTQLMQPPTLHLISRRASTITSALVSAALSLSPAISNTAVAQTSQISTTQTNSDGKQAGPTRTATASIRGEIVDTAQAFIQGAKVMLRNEATGETSLRFSTESGSYSFDNLTTGAYRVTVEMAGFKRAVLEQITLQAGERKAIELRLEFAAESVVMGAMVEPILSLRALYEKSEVIVDATIGASVLVEVDNETKWIKTALQVNSQFKGENMKKVLTWYHAAYSDEEPEYQIGDQILFFLNARKEKKEGYELSDYSRGSKKLSAADLQSYTARLQELVALNQQRKPTSAEITEWLIRCIQDPATRWEGARDLLEFQSRSKEQCEKTGTPPRVHDEVATLVQSLVKALPADDENAEAEPAEATALLPESLNLQQKEQLANILLNIEKLSSNDNELLRLVTTWETKRIIPFLLAQLHQIESQPPLHAAELMTVLAELLDDTQISELAEEYEQKSEYADEEIQSPRLSPEEKEELREDALVHPIQRRQRLQNFVRVVEAKLRNTPQTIR